VEHVRHDPPPGLSVDESWPRAGAWLAEGVPDAEAVDLTVVGVPAHRTSLSPTGAHATPGAVRAALWRLGTHAASRQVDVGDLRVRDLGDLSDPDADEAETRRVVDSAARSSRLTVLVGGDNSITFAGALGAIGDDLSRAGLVTLDAHHDVRDGVSNGSPVRRLVEAGLEPRRIVQVGIADFANSAQYRRRVDEWGVRVMTTDDVRRRGMTAVMRDALEIAGRAGGAVYVDLDVDVCDRSVAPGCPASLPGGLAAHELREAAYLAGLHPQVVAIDTTEVDATADAPDGRTVRLAAICIMEAAAGLAKRAR
jgi:formiminoglutamase